MHMTEDGARAWPHTVDEAVELLRAQMSAADQARVRDTPSEDLSRFHFGWGQGIRNAFGLHRRNTELLAACGSPDLHPDEAAMVIIAAVWRRLSATPPQTAN
jgi:hypothetical protein